MITLDEKDIEALQRFRTRYHICIALTAIDGLSSQILLWALVLGISSPTDIISLLVGILLLVTIGAVGWLYRATASNLDVKTNYDYDLIARGISENAAPEGIQEAMRFVLSDRELASRIKSVTNNPIILFISAVLATAGLGNLIWGSITEDVPVFLGIVSAPLMLGSTMLTLAMVFLIWAAVMHIVSGWVYVDKEQLTEAGKQMIRTELARISQQPLKPRETPDKSE